MKVETLTFVYNEEFLLPFYLKHYEWCDKLNVIYDTDSKDKTLEILKSNTKVNILPFTFPDGMDDSLKVARLNDLYKSSKSDLILNVDCDEFIFDKELIIEKAKLDPIINVKLCDVYRNIKECDLDINKSIKEQRRYGHIIPFYNKPIIVKTGLDIIWKPGNHELVNGKRVDCGIVGSHWANADLNFCIERRIKNRKERQSKINLACHMTLHNHHITSEDVIKQCKAHENDPELW